MQNEPNITQKPFQINVADRVRRLARERFPADRPLTVGKWVPVRNRKGRRCLVRILEVHDRSVVVDTNRRWAGQAMELEVELIDIRGPDAGEPAGGS